MEIEETVKHLFLIAKSPLLSKEEILKEMQRILSENDKNKCVRFAKDITVRGYQLNHKGHWIMGDRYPVEEDIYEDIKKHFA